MKKYLILGLGKSGVSAAHLLAEGNDVTCWDAKPEEMFSQKLLDELKAQGIKFVFEKTELDEHFDVCVISPGIKPDHPVAKYADKIEGELELAYVKSVARFAAITGTNGKTTTTTLVGELIKASEMPCEVVGNIGSPVCDYVSRAGKETLFVTEVSSYQLETIKTFHPHVSAILNLSPDHLDRHGSAEEYYRCKGRVFENQNEADYLVYNADDEEVIKLISNANVCKIPFSRTKADVDLAMESSAAYLKDGMIVLKFKGKERPLASVDELQIPGNHNIENVLAAVLIAALCGANTRRMAKVIKAFKGVEHRMENVRELKGVKYINDSKGTNPDSSIKAIEAISTPIILIAGGYEKNTDFHGFINSFNGKVRYMILLGQTAERLAKEAKECGFKDEDIIKCSTLEACVAAAAKLAEKGDTVLLSPACASWGMFENFEQRGEEFKRLVGKL